jgi:RimJ/RimL family protein N-acetyltransferase
MLKFESITKYEKGLIFSLLSQTFAELWNEKLDFKIRNFDNEAFENPDTVGACTFITTLNGQVVGMASYDPRQGPEIGIIGYNCVVTEFQGKGFGTQQIKEVLRRFGQMKFKKAAVTTGDHPFFIPAQKMYLSCGFKETKKYNDGRDPRYGSVDYEIDLRTGNRE